MDQRNPLAGGCLMTGAIFIGLAVGIAIHSPITGVVGGTVVGAGAALATWLIDRRRTRP